MYNLCLNRHTQRGSIWIHTNVYTEIHLIHTHSVQYQFSWFKWQYKIRTWLINKVKIQQSRRFLKPLINYITIIMQWVFLVYWIYLMKHFSWVHFYILFKRFCQICKFLSLKLKKKYMSDYLAYCMFYVARSIKHHFFLRENLSFFLSKNGLLIPLKNKINKLFWKS